MKMFRTPRFLRLIYRRRTWGFSLAPGEVYLTFDDGPHPDITPWVLDELKKHDIRACFFCVGENVKRYPEIYARILREGHLTGNHTMRHENAAKTKPQAYLRSVAEASWWIDSPYFRPPYGRLSQQLAKALGKKYHLIMWSWLSYDYDRSLPLDRILDRARRDIRAGDIVVLHDNPKIADRQQELLPQLIAIIREKQLAFGRPSLSK
jgi:peptidoglycan/xylan/chitin deacetylase (PgdA/CDA1 family)